MIPIHIRRLIPRLSSDPVVKSVKYGHWFILVKFRSGINEAWLLGDGIGHERPRYRFKFVPGHSDPAPIRTQYEVEPKDPEAELKRSHKILEYKLYKKACFIEQRLAVHRFLHDLVTRGPTRLWYPNVALLNDYRRLVKLNTRRHWSKGELVAAMIQQSRNQGSPGKTIMEHFFEIEKMAGPRGFLKDRWRPFLLYKIIKKLLGHRSDLTRQAVTRCLMMDERCGPKIIAPGTYLAMLRRCGISPHSVLDVAPTLGNKILAAAAVGAKVYRYVGEIKQSHRDLAKFLSIGIEAQSDQVNDVAFVDVNLQPVDTQIEPKCRHLFRVVTRDTEGQGYISSFNVIAGSHLIRRSPHLGRLYNKVLYYRLNKNR